MSAKKNSFGQLIGPVGVLAGGLMYASHFTFLFLWAVFAAVLIRVVVPRYY